MCNSSRWYTLPMPLNTGVVLRVMINGGIPRKSKDIKKDRFGVFFDRKSLFFFCMLKFSDTARYVYVPIPLQ